MSQDQDRPLPLLSVQLGFFAFGCVIALGQVLLLREFLVTFHGTEICIGAFYGSWFLWIGIGALWGPRLLAGFSGEAGSYLALHLAFPAAVLAEIVLLRTLRTMIGVGPDELLPLETLLLASAVLTMPAGAIIGALFPITGKLLQGLGRDPISLGYAWESAGSLAGGVVFTYLLASRFDPMVTLAAMGMLEAVVVAVVALGGRHRRAVVAAAVGFAAYGCLLTPLGSALDRATEQVRWWSLQRGYRLVAVRHTPYCHVAVGRDRGGQYGIFYDGIQRTTFPDPPRFREEAALAMAQHPRAARVLVLGGGAEGLIQELLAYPIRQIHSVEDDPWALSLIKRYLPPGQRRALQDRRVRIIVQDGRLYVNQRAGGRRYDLVISRAADPTTASLNRYFTREFFRGVRRILAPHGVLLVRTVAARAFHSDEALRTAASVYQTLRSVFREVVLVSHQGTLFAASPVGGRVSGDPAVLAGRHGRIPMAGAALLADGLRGSVSAERARALLRRIEITRVALNTDTRPSTYFHAIRLWGRMSGSELTALFGAVERAGVWLFLIPLFILALARVGYRLSVPNPVQSRRTHAAVAIGVTGFASMALQILILMGFQSHLGSLYQKVALLNGMFMMGLALGAILGRLAAGRVPAPRLRLAAGLGLFALFGLAVPEAIEWLGQNGNGHIAGVYYGMSGICGLLTGMLFPLAVACFDPAGEEIKHTASVIDAADHVGACLGGLLAGAIIVPTAGQQTTAQVVALAIGVPAVLLGLDWLLERQGWRQGPVMRRSWSFPWLRTSWVLAAVTVGVLACALLIRCSPAPGPATVMKPFPHKPYFRKVKDKERPKAPAKKKLVGVGLETRHLAGDIKGYGGPINLWVRFDARGNLEQVALRSHNETPAYIQGLPGWLRLLEGHRFDRPFTGKGGVDVLTGATVTSEAVLHTLARARHRVARDLLGLSPRARPPPSRPSAWARVFRGPRPFVVLAFLLCLIPVYLWGGWAPRLLLLGTSVVLLGFWYNVPMTAVDLAGLGLGSLPGGGEKVVLVLGVLVLAAAFGQVWCGYGCPFGALQEFLWLVVHPKGIRGGAGLGPARQITPALEQRARYLKYGLLCLVLGFYWISGDASYLALDPMVHVFGGRIPGVVVLLLVALAVASLVHLRPFCRYFCPTGAFLALFNKVRLLDLAAPRRAVRRCDLGVTSRAHLDCLRCNRCVIRPAAEPAAGES